MKLEEYNNILTNIKKKEEQLCEEETFFQKLIDGDEAKIWSEKKQLEEMFYTTDDQRIRTIISNQMDKIELNQRHCRELILEAQSDFSNRFKEVESAKEQVMLEFKLEEAKKEI